MELDKNNITTYITGALIAILGFIGISESTTNSLIQILSPIISIVIAIIVSYYNEKHPSNMVTTVYTKQNINEIAEDVINEINDKTCDNIDGI